MPLIAGIDIGNATTEVAGVRRPAGEGVCCQRDRRDDGHERDAGQYRGTLAALEQGLCENTVVDERCLCIYLNEAAPVIGDVAMETITETIITESTMIGHNPQTPGGVGVGVGRLSPRAAGDAAGGAVCRGVIVPGLTTPSIS